MDTQNKKIKKISSKIMYVLIGILISLSFYSVQAAWNDTTSSGQTLTASLWNDLVSQITNLTGGNFDNGLYLGEIAEPTEQVDKGIIYVKSGVNNKLYFKSEDGTEYDLTAGGYSIYAP